MSEEKVTFSKDGAYKIGGPLQEMDVKRDKQTEGGLPDGTAQTGATTGAGQTQSAAVKPQQPKKLDMSRLRRSASKAKPKAAETAETPPAPEPKPKSKPKAKPKAAEPEPEAPPAPEPDVAAGKGVREMNIDSTPIAESEPPSSEPAPVPAPEPPPAPKPEPVPVPTPEPTPASEPVPQTPPPPKTQAFNLNQLKSSRTKGESAPASEPATEAPSAPEFNLQTVDSGSKDSGSGREKVSEMNLGVTEPPKQKAEPIPEPAPEPVVETAENAPDFIPNTLEEFMAFTQLEMKDLIGFTRKVIQASMRGSTIWQSKQHELLRAYSCVVAQGRNVPRNVRCLVTLGWDVHITSCYVDQNFVLSDGSSNLQCTGICASIQGTPVALSLERKRLATLV